MKKSHLKISRILLISCFKRKTEKIDGHYLSGMVKWLLHVSQQKLRQELHVHYPMIQFLISGKLSWNDVEIVFKLLHL